MVFDRGASIAFAIAETGGGQEAASDEEAFRGKKLVFGEVTEGPRLIRGSQKAGTEARRSTPEPLLPGQEAQHRRHPRGGRVGSELYHSRQMLRRTLRIGFRFAVVPCGPADCSSRVRGDDRPESLRQA
jgi:hypothetical protein